MSAASLLTSICTPGQPKSADYRPVRHLAGSFSAVSLQRGIRCARQSREQGVGSGGTEPEISKWEAAKLVLNTWSTALVIGFGGNDALARLLGKTGSSLAGIEKVYIANGNECLLITSLLIVISSDKLGRELLLRSRASNRPTAGAIGLVGALAAYTAVQTLSQIRNTPPHVSGFGIPPETIEPAICAGVFTAGLVLAPLAEELVYRAIGLQCLTAFTSKQTAAIVSALAFAAGHFSLQDFPELTVLGLALGTVFIASNSWLGAAVIAHGGYNLLVLWQSKDCFRS